MQKIKLLVLLSLLSVQPILAMDRPGALSNLAATQRTQQESEKPALLDKIADGWAGGWKRIKRAVRGTNSRAPVANSVTQSPAQPNAVQSDSYPAASPLLPPGRSNSRSSQLGRSHDELTYADQRLKELTKQCNQALRKNKKTRNKLAWWSFACVGSSLFTYYSWECGLSSKFILGGGAATAVSSLGAMHHYLRSRKHSRQLDELQKSLEQLK